MAEGINKGLDSDKPVLIDKVDFNTLNPKLQSTIINGIYKDKKGGWVGRFLGTNTANVAMNIAFILCIILLAIVIGDFIRISFNEEGFNYELFESVIPVLTLTLGYIFGKGTNKSNK